MLAQIYRINKNIHFEPFDEGALVLKMPERNFYELNLSALKVITLTDGNRNVQQVSEMFSSCFNITQNEALSDVLSLCQHLHSQDIIEVVQN